MSGTSKRGGWGTTAGFLLLCLLWAAEALRGDLLPGTSAGQMPLLEKQAVQYGMLAVAATAWMLARKQKWPEARRALAWVLVGAGLFLAPPLLVHFSRAWIGELTRVALFSLVPVFAVVVEPYVGRGETAGRGSSGLLATLAGVAGTLLVFPVDMPGSMIAAAGWFAVIAAALCIAAANCRAVLLADEAQSLAPVIAIVCGAAAAGFAAASALTEHAVWRINGGEGAWMLVMTIPVLLLFWLLRHMEAVPMTTRFLVAPLLANLAGLALLRPAVSLRAGFGLALIAIGAGWLLFVRVNEPEDIDAPQRLHLD